MPFMSSTFRFKKVHDLMVEVYRNFLKAIRIGRNTYWFTEESIGSCKHVECSGGGSIVITKQVIDGCK